MTLIKASDNPQNQALHTAHRSHQAPKASIVTPQDHLALFDPVDAEVMLLKSSSERLYEKNHHTQTIVLHVSAYLCSAYVSSILMVYVKAKIWPIAGML